MPIIVALVVLVAVIYGAFWSFHAISAALGIGVAIGAAVIAALVVVSIAVYFWLRWKEVAPNVHDGDWTHELKREWGGVRLAAAKRLCEVRVGGQVGMFIFADLRGARPAREIGVRLIGADGGDDSAGTSHQRLSGDEVHHVVERERRVEHNHGNV